MEGEIAFGNVNKKEVKRNPNKSAFPFYILFYFIGLIGLIDLRKRSMSPKKLFWRPEMKGNW